METRHCGEVANKITRSRGDVFVVRTKNPSNTSEKMGYFDRVTVSLPDTFYRPQTKRLRARKIGLQSFLLLGTSCLGRPSVTLRATCRAPARIWLAVIDFQNGEQQSRSGSDKNWGSEDSFTVDS